MEAKITGIKCNNPNCNYRDDSITWDNIEETAAIFMNKPCPKCGTPLLTQEEFDSTKKLIFVMEELEKIAEEINPNNDNEKEKGNISIKSNGTGDQELQTEKNQFNLSKEQINELYQILQTPQGKKIVKMMLLTQNGQL